LRNLRLDICYDGTRYRGWQRLPNTDNTIQGKLETALSRILGEAIEIIGSGRTDAGVHAQHQIANFHCSSDMPCEEILEQLLAEQACFSLKQMAVNGRDLLALGLQGPAVGAVLERLLDGVVEGDLPNEREDLLRAAEQMKEEYNGL